MARLWLTFTCASVLVLAGPLTAVADRAAPLPGPEGDRSKSGMPKPLVAEGGRWSLSFNEEFDRDLDRRVWRTAFKDAGSEPASISDRSLYGNRERQVYFDPEFLGLGVQPLSTRSGLLTITARPMTPTIKAEVAKALEGRPENLRASALKDVAYTSGMISTRGAFAQTYGYFEMRARWSGGKGLWPAFWLLPVEGHAPPELDVVEALGHQSSTIYQSLHSKPKGQKKIDHTEKVTGVDTRNFHTYGMLWTPEEIRFYVDGQEKSRHPTPQDAHKAMFLLVNLAVGGRWPGDPDGTSQFPATMDVDFVRAWRRAPA